MTFRLHPKAELDLEWLLSDEARGDCGVQSTAAGQLAAIELGTLIQRTSKRDFTLDEDSRHLAAVRRLREVSLSWGLVSRHHQQVLAAAYGPRGPRRPVDLGGFTSVEWGTDLGGVVFLSPAAREEHARSRTSRDFLDWLQRLSGRLSGRLPPGNRDQRRKDLELRAQLLVQAQAIHDEAARAYQAAWERVQNEKRRFRREQEDQHAA